MTTHLADSLASSLGPNYALDRELEGGGMSRLFLATDLTLDRRVVVKVLASELVSPESTARFKREIALTIKLQHPNILPILSSGSFGDCLYYVTPYIAGESLRARLKRDRQLTLDDTLKILRDVSDALAFAHAEGVVHRDVKPGNILLASGHAILADFGIARAIETQTNPLTASGLMPGTPAYMSPELPTDASADVFGLGVVAYEMLCGELPLNDVTVGRIIAARRTMQDSPRGALLALADLVSRTVSTARTPRVVEASVFLQRVENSRARRQPNRRFAAIAAGVTAVACLAGGWAYMSSSWRADLHSATYMIVAADPNAPAAHALIADVQSYLEEWQGVVTVDASNKTVIRLDALDGLVRNAARSQARNLLIVSGRSFGDSLEVQARLVDVAGRQPVRDVRTRLAATRHDSTATMALRRFANAIVRDGDELPWKVAASRVRPNIDAWRAYDRGRAALSAWKLEDAAREFHGATTTDPLAALAQLWLAQTLQWIDPERRDDARAAVLRATTARGALSSRDSMHAAGLAASIDGRYLEAQRAFRAILDRDSTYSPAWVDLGESLAADDVVVPSRSSWTRWAFRSSYEEAARAYRHAEITADRTAPNFRGWILGRLARVLIAAPNHYRLGVGFAGDTLYVGSLPYFDADTEAFAPHPRADFKTRKDDPPFERVRQSVTRSRAILRSTAEEWVRAAPGDATAYDSLAIWSELSGGKAYVDGKQFSTLELIRQARTLSRDTAASLPLAVAEVRALLKESRFEDARRMADSLVRNGANARDVPGVIGLFALLGRVHETARQLPLAATQREIQLPSTGPWTTPRPLAEAAGALLTYSVFGGVPDSVRALVRRTCDLIGDYVSGRDRVAVVRGMLVAATFGYDDAARAGFTACPTDPPDEVVAAVSLFAHGDRDAAATQLDHIKEIDRGKEPGKGLRMSYRIARLRLALGDTASALAELDEIIRTLPIHDPAFLEDVTHVVSLVRSFALRAEIGAKQGNRRQAAQDARVVATLWQHGDSQLRPVVDSMRETMSTRP